MEKQLTISLALLSLSKECNQRWPLVTFMLVVWPYPTSFSVTVSETLEFVSDVLLEGHGVSHSVLSSSSSFSVTEMKAKADITLACCFSRTFLIGISQQPGEEGITSSSSLTQAQSNAETCPSDPARVGQAGL